MLAELGESSTPSVHFEGGAEERDKSALVSLLEQLTTSTALYPVFLETSKLLVVVSIQRYLRGPGNEERSRSASSYLFDVTVTDGITHVKCHLAPALNSLVHWNCLRAGRGIHITRCSLVHDEKRLNRCFLQIEALELAAAYCDPSLSILSLSIEPLRSLTASQRGRDLLRTLQTEAPLRVGRHHYLPLWNNNDPCGREWIGSKTPPFLNVPLEGFGLISLQDLSMTWRTNVGFPRILVRIMHKSRLRYYGRPQMDFPYQAYFEVADQSGMMPLVLWNSLCPEWYQSLHVGTVLLLHRYSVKDSYQMRTWATPRDPQIKSLRTIEICLNPRDPRAEIQIVPHQQVKAEWRLPDIKYNFITRLELDQLSEGFTCDIIGLVTFVGRCQRIRKEDSSEDFYLYRWVHAVDGSTEQPFVLELFATSQPETFQQIHPMTYLVCTQMRLVRELRPGGVITTVPYLTTSNESQISISGHHKGQPYTKDPKVQGFIRWVKGQHEKDVMKSSVIGGYYSFPPAPKLFQEYCKNLDAEALLTSTSELKKEIESLHYKEHKRLILQGTIVAVQYICHTDPAVRLGAVPIQEVDAFGASSSQPVRCLHGPEKDTRVIQQTEQLRVNPVRHHQRQSTPIFTRYWLRNRYPLRDLQKSYDSKCQAHKPLRKKLSNPPTGMPKQKRKVNRQGAMSSKRPAAAQDAEVAASTKGSSQAAEQPVPPDEDDYGRCDTGVTTDGNSKYTWRSPTWSEIREHLSEHLHFGQLLPESLPRRFVYKHRDFLMQQHNLQAAECSPATAISNMELQSFASACCHGYYTVTMVDQIIKTAADLDNTRVICILDVCHHGEGKSEVILHKMYRMTE
ncbi:RPA-related protein RADX isoform X3 [Chiloscyllium plagiosum]|uniref:RPA-related protein RADX isoform X3 n=1 Tax=Chiloscyllium plagiosum TaxID=36176 RepID=UPI001CB85227|nr:RPA-related protein RADX isoform X3 [Chiloscyllium plagiosum]